MVVQSMNNSVSKIHVRVPYIGFGHFQSSLCGRGSGGTKVKGNNGSSGGIMCTVCTTNNTRSGKIAQYMTNFNIKSYAPSLI